MPWASLIIPCFNNLRYTRACVESVQRWTSPPFELILIDDGSTDGTGAYARALARRCREARVIANPRNLGFAASVNRGMKAARGDRLVWLNNDALMTPGWLEALSACAESSRAVGAAGPCTNEIPGLQRISVPYRGARGLDSFAAAWGLRHQGRSRSVPYLTGFCLLVKREAFRAVGGLDEELRGGCFEDLDYCLRLRRAGFELRLAEEAFVHHWGRRTFRRLAGVGRRVAESRRLFMEKWRRSPDLLAEIDPDLACADL